MGFRIRWGHSSANPIQGIRNESYYNKSSNRSALKEAEIKGIKGKEVTPFY